MNRRRVLIILTAVVLALFGMFVIVAFVGSAERRALQGTELVPVLVATTEIDANTPASELGDLVTTEDMPARLRQEDAVRDISSLEDQVATSPIRAGEQIVQRQFGAAEDMQGGPAGDIEEGKEIVSVALEPQRAVGGRLSNGDLVSVIVSLGEAEVQDEDDPTQTTSTGGTTGVVLTNVPVTAVSGGVTGESGGEAAAAVMVSLEVDGSDAERIVFGMEHGTVWLTLNGENVGRPDVQTRSADNIYDARGGGS
ncbi:MAG: Flp pilus assembly protein CpaB [Actinobacteria bacterium]|nr:Flp pilus assembly protein CpaB [Actinomycetota bacterium]